MSDQSISVRQIFSLLKEAAEEFARDNVTRLSAALSYYSLFSVAPLILIAIGFIGRVYGVKAAEGKVALELGQFLGSQAAQAVQSVVQSASKSSGGATIVGFIMLLVGASTVFGQLKDSLNFIWKVRQKSGLGWLIFAKAYLLTYGLVLATGFLLLVSLLLTTFVAGLAHWMQAQLGISGLVSGLFGFALPLLIEGFLFAMIFRILPDAEIQWPSVWVGSAVTAILFEIGKVGLSLYLGRGGATSSFGAAGSVVLLLLWVYYASCILLYGAEFTAVYARRMGHPVMASRIAEPTEVWTPKGRMPADCLDSPAVAAARGQLSGPSPRQESLAPLLASQETLEPEIIPEFTPQPRGWFEKANQHPAAELSAALGIGLVFGCCVRVVESLAMGRRR